MNNAQREIKKRWLIYALPIVMLLLSIPLGRYPISLDQLLTVLSGGLLPLSADLPATLNTVIFQVRIPRILAALVVGAALAAAGTAYQGIFKNPLVSPDLLGATAGAGFGAALAILLSGSYVTVQMSAFFFSLLAVACTYLISQLVRKHDPILILVLAGILVGTVFSSFISLIKYLADPTDKLPAITFWLMGGLTSIRTSDLLQMLVPVLIGMIPLYLLRWQLNVMAFGDEEAQALGIETERLRLVVILCSTLMTAGVVSISGMVGWVGLVIPHLARLLVGPNHLVLYPVAIALGGSFLLLVDTLARLLLPVEIPLGILTSLIGAPFFIYLLIYTRR